MKTMNHEYYVDLEVAKLLKEAGFDWECDYRYITEPDYNIPSLVKKPSGDGAQDKYLVDAPTIDVAQKWLREVMKIEVFVEPFIGFYKYVVEELKENGIYSEGRSESYEEALEAGIKKVLEIILGKEK